MTLGSLELWISGAQQSLQDLWSSDSWISGALELRPAAPREPAQPRAVLLCVLGGGGGRGGGFG